nr:hypothetical protein Q903MT_gene4417 [Picea sitchensis]
MSLRERNLRDRRTEIDYSSFSIQSRFSLDSEKKCASVMPLICYYSHPFYLLKIGGPLIYRSTASY